LQGENADENEAQLDEEMEKVFSEPGISKFDVRRLSDVKPPSSSKDLDKQDQQAAAASLNLLKYNEQEYDCELCFECCRFEASIQELFPLSSTS